MIVESGEIREVMHAALLLGFGASALNPYMAFAVLDRLVKDKDIQLDYTTAEKNYIKSICKGLFKIMSKMGISTIRSYRGAKIFEAVGLSEELSKAYFGGLGSPIEGIRLEEIARDAIAFHKEGFESIKNEELLKITVCMLSVKMEKSTHGIRKQSALCNWLHDWGVIKNLKSTPIW